MRNKLFYVLVLTLCLALTTGSAFAATVNFVVNPGVEDGTGTTAPPWYSNQSWGGGTGQAVLGTTSNPAHSGLRMWMQNGDATASTGTQCPMQAVSIVPGGSYNSSVWIRVPSASPTNPVSARLRLWFGNAVNNFITGFYGPYAVLTSPDWTKLEDGSAGAGLVPDPTCDLLQFRIFVENAGQQVVYIDDAAVMGTSFTVSGSVLKADGGAAAGATVTLLKAGVAVAPAVVTGSNGSYSFQVGPGDYTVSASLTNYQAATATVPSVVNSDQVVPTITLAKLPTTIVSGQVYKMSGTSKVGVAGATVTATSTSGTTAASPVTTTSGQYSFELAQNQQWTLAVQAPFGTKIISVPAAFTPTSGTMAGMNIELADRVVPQTDKLLFSCVADSLPESGTIAGWPTYYPTGQTLTPIAGPTAETINGKKWVKNTATGDAGPNTGFRFGTEFTSPIVCDGASIVVAVKPVRSAWPGNNWQSVVDMFYDRLCLVMNNTTGLVGVRRNSNWGTDWSTVAIPDGQTTVLSLVVQPDSSYKVFANGAEILSNAGNNIVMDKINPNHTDMWGWDAQFAHFVNVGRNDPDGWTAFNGNIGDVFVYKVALTDAERNALEMDMGKSLGIVKKISGRVVTSAGDPVAGAQLRLINSGAVSDLNVFTDSQGKYAVEMPLPSGSYQVSATKVNTLEAIPANLDVVDATDNYIVGDIILDPITDLVTISGKVTDSVSGLPASGLKLAVTSASMAVTYNTQTAADGTYSVPVVLGMDYVVDIDPSLKATTTLLTPLAERTTEALMEDWTVNLAVVYMSTLSGKVVTTGGVDPSGFVVVAKDSAGAVAGTGNTNAAGTYSIVVQPQKTYTVTAKKAGYVTLPGPQSVNVAAGNATYPVGDFTATAASIKGVLKNAVTGQPIRNGVVQTGGAGGDAIVTDDTGAFNFTAASGCGGVELFGDALGYHAKNLLVTGNGNLNKTIALTPENETGVVVNGDFETVVDGKPANWVEAWTAGGLVMSASPDAFSGLYSAFVSATASYSAMTQAVTLEPGFVYSAYFKAKADPTVAQWFPMLSFRGPDPSDPVNTPDAEYKGWIAGETGHDGWVHTPPQQWMQYLKFHTYSGDPIQPFVRIAAPAGATNITASFCFADLPGAGLGCYVDDLVIDKVNANEPLVTVAPDAEPNVPVANITALKGAAVGTAVKLTGNATVTYAPRNASNARSTSFFYVGEAQGLGGLRVVDKTDDSLNIGDTVTGLTGTVKKTAAGEIYLELSADPTGTAGAAIPAIGLNNKSVATDAKAQTNAVRVWGKASITGANFTIDDGYGTPITVVVNGVALPADLDTKTAVVTGVVSKDDSGKPVVLLQKVSAF